MVDSAYSCRIVLLDLKISLMSRGLMLKVLIMALWGLIRLPQGLLSM